MRKVLFLYLLCSTIYSSAQRNVVYIHSFPLKLDFKNQVIKGMNKHHKTYHGNDFYNFNVNNTPLSVTEDTILYNVKFIAAKRLWGRQGKFYKSSNLLVCDISNLILLKKTSLSGVDYINVAVNDMEDTKGNKINLHLLEDEIRGFFKKFK
jgi:hypothetical protein